MSASGAVGPRVVNGLREPTMANPASIDELDEELSAIFSRVRVEEASLEQLLQLISGEKRKLLGRRPSPRRQEVEFLCDVYRLFCCEVKLAPIAQSVRRMRKVLQNTEVAPHKALLAAAGFAGRCATEGRKDLAAQYLDTAIQRVQALSAWDTFSQEGRETFCRLLDEYRRA